MADRLHVELEPVAGASWADVPPEARLRRLLKLAIRSCGLRVLSVARLPNLPLDRSDEADAPRPAPEAGRSAAGDTGL